LKTKFPKFNQPFFHLLQGFQDAQAGFGRFHLHVQQLHGLFRTVLGLRFRLLDCFLFRCGQFGLQRFDFFLRLLYFQGQVVNRFLLTRRECVQFLLRKDGLPAYPIGLSFCQFQVQFKRLNIGLGTLHLH